VVRGIDKCFSSCKAVSQVPQSSSTRDQLQLEDAIGPLSGSRMSARGFPEDLAKVYIGPISQCYQAHQSHHNSIPLLCSIHR
jgi:hypothetical protein